MDKLEQRAKHDTEKFMSKLRESNNGKRITKKMHVCSFFSDSEDTVVINNTNECLEYSRLIDSNLRKFGLDFITSVISTKHYGGVHWCDINVVPNTLTKRTLNRLFGK